MFYSISDLLFGLYVLINNCMLITQEVKMGYTKFSSVDYILNYNYRTKGEIIDALGALNAMFNDKNINEYQYKNAKALLESKLKALS